MQSPSKSKKAAEWGIDRAEFVSGVRQAGSDDR